MNFYEDANKVGKEAMDNTLRSFSAMTKGFQKLATQSADFARQNYENSAEAMEKLAQVKSMDRAFEVQSEFAKTAYERFVAQTSTMTEICSDIAKDTYRPFENTMQTAAHKVDEEARSV